MIKFFTQTLPGIRYFTFWILIIGCVLYAFGYFHIFNYKHEWLYDFAKTFGSICMSSAVFMGIVKSYQFTGIFKEELRKVVTAEDHLSRRTDIEKIWENVTMQLCKQKFKRISNKLQRILKQYYLPIDDEYYYRNTKLTIEIEHNPEYQGYINVLEEFKTTIIIEESNNIKYKYTSSIPYPNDKMSKTSFEIVEFTVNEKEIKWSKGKELKQIQSNNVCSSNFDIKISCSKEKKEYVLYRKTKKCYSLDCNQYMGHIATGLYENYDIHITYPKDITFECLGLGVLGKWQIKPNENKIYRTIKASYNGLVFKNQGILFLYK